MTWPVTTVSDGGNIKCECGNHKKVKLIVVDGYKILAPTTCVPVGGKNVGLTLVKTIPDPNNPANYDISPWMGIWSMLPKGVAAVFYYHGAEYEGPLEFPEVDVEIKGKMPGTYVDVTATDNGTDVDTINLEIVGLNSITVSDK